MAFQLRSCVPRSTMHGLIYQQYLLRLALHRGLQFKTFELWSEIDHHGILDDIVFKTNGSGGMEEYVCIQVKHSKKGGEKIKYDDLLPFTENGERPFSVRRLFMAYVLWQEYGRTRKSANGYSVCPALYTNWDLDFQDAALNNSFRFRRLQDAPLNNSFRFRRLNEDEAMTLRKLLFVPSESNAHAFVIDNWKDHDILDLEVLHKPVPHYGKFREVIEKLSKTRIDDLKKKFLKNFVFCVNQGGVEKIYETILQEIEMKLQEPARHDVGLFSEIHRPPSCLSPHSILKLIHFHSDLPDIGISYPRTTLYLNEHSAAFALHEIWVNVCKIHIEGLSQFFFDTTSESLVDPDPIEPNFQDRQWVYNDVPTALAMSIIKNMYSDCLFFLEETFMKIYKRFNVSIVFRECDIRHLALVHVETVEAVGLQDAISSLLSIQNLSIIFIRPPTGAVG